MTKRDALRLLENDLDRLLQTAEPDNRADLQQEMGRFADLFGRFLQEGMFSLYKKKLKYYFINSILSLFYYTEGPSIDWNKIQKLPENAVMDYSSLKSPKNEQVSFILFVFLLKFSELVN